MKNNLLKELLLSSAEPIKYPQDIGDGCTVMKSTGKVSIDKSVYEAIIKHLTEQEGVV